MSYRRALVHLISGLRMRWCGGWWVAAVANVDSRRPVRHVTPLSGPGPGVASRFGRQMSAGAGPGCLRAVRAGMQEAGLGEFLHYSHRGRGRSPAREESVHRSWCRLGGVG